MSKPVGTAYLTGYLMAHDTFPEEYAYEFVKANIEQWGDMQATLSYCKKMAPADLAVGPEEKFHKGAIRAFKEAGFR